MIKVFQYKKCNLKIISKTEIRINYIDIVIFDMNMYIVPTFSNEFSCIVYCIIFVNIEF